MTFTSGREDEFLHRLTKFTGENLTNEQFGVSELAGKMGMSRSNLHRKVKSTLGISASRFICQQRLKSARKILENSTSSISEAAFESGFHSVSYFTRCFHDFYGFSPGKLGQILKEEKQVSDQVNQERAIHSRRARYSHRFLWTALTIIAALVGINTISQLSRYDRSHEKSIAVLPFINDSPEESEMHFVNGSMDAILNHLSKIKDLRVISRTSVEQYRDHPKPIPDIAREMNVSYILEGSGIKHGDQIRLTVQLIDALNDQHLWSRSFTRQIDEVFILYSEVAQRVAGQMEAEVTPEELKRIEHIPTSNPIAYEFWQKGLEEEWKYKSAGGDQEALMKSKDLYLYALEYDSAFAEAYVGLGRYFMKAKVQDRETSNHYLDTIYALVEKALKFDTHLASAYCLKGNLLNHQGEMEMARKNFALALEQLPNCQMAIHGMAWSNYSIGNSQEALTYFQKSIAIDPGPDNIFTFRYMGDVFWESGYLEQSAYYHGLALNLDGDSASYYLALAKSEWFINNNRAKAMKLLHMAYLFDSTNFQNLMLLGSFYLALEQYPESLIYYEKYLAQLDRMGVVEKYQSHRIGLSYWFNEDKTKANFYFDQQLKYCRELVSSNKIMHATMAEIYALRGEKEEAFKQLRLYNQFNRMSVYVLLFDNQFFDQIRDEPEFQQIVRELEAKYYVEHDRVGRWLQENS